ncbi:hypothetical protein F0919_00755 [Taibaiella lutea]|uniref:Uncharacterized protein n=1 Tax=Taibaiella lutea TaxID=2608001 RepID=A0A5M6CLX9_9BACT|nr:hypothetical protein [Taibaiella lutea]KAA5536228.1 hypothetical protein F0919_00755 [Taibaiella lutea]
MASVKITLVNNSKKSVTYKHSSGSGNLPAGARRETVATVGTTLYFENDNGAKYTIAESDRGKIFYYNR